MAQQTLSVIMPNYNHAGHLPESLQAILDQSYQPKEIIIADDASTDNSVEIIQDFARKYPHIRLIRNEQNLGAIKNINQLFELATGEYIYGAGADDLVLPGFFEKSMQILHQYPQAGLCSTLTQYIDKFGTERGTTKSPFIYRNHECYLSPTQSLEVFRWLRNWPHGNTMIAKRHALLEAGGFIEELGLYSDAFMAQVIALLYGACFIPEPLTCFRIVDTGYSVISGSNIERMGQIISHIDKLVQTKYNDLFPMDYLNSLKKHLTFAAPYNAWKLVRRNQENFFENTFNKLFPRERWWNRLFSKGMNLSFKLQSLLVNLYLFFMLGYWSVWLKATIRRRINFRFSQIGVDNPQRHNDPATNCDNEI